MLFNSYIFMLLFLPLCITGYFLLNHFGRTNLAMLFLFVMSLWFYGYFHPSYLILILLSIVLNYLFTWAMAQTAGAGLRKAEMIAAVLMNLGILFFFKYYNFFLENLGTLLHTELTLHTILLPLGISFFTFQQISYVVDCYHGQAGHYSFLQYASFVAYFPQLIAGPIVTHDELIPQFMDPDKKKFQWDHFAQGMFLFSMGLAKKVLIADVFGNAANWGFANVELLDTTNAFVSSLAYTVQIYFDFSGYSDMAIGIGKMMNINLPVNFDSPYKALTITEFWQRWHRTLTRFFTKYVYIPLGGNRKGTLRTYCNIMIVFLASGLWHGANWTFVLWGGLHGMFMVVTRHFKGWFEKLHPALNWLMTFSFANMTWILFRSDSIADAIKFIKRLLMMECGPVNESVVSAFLLPEWKFLVQNTRLFGLLEYRSTFFLTIYYVGIFALLLGARNAYEHMMAFKPGLKNLTVTALLLIWCVLSFSGISIFLYFNF